MTTGLVKRWIETYGFLSQPNGGDVFVHVSSLPAGRTHLAVGEAVVYDIATGERGTYACNVKVQTGKDADVERAYAQNTPVRMGE